MTTFKQLMLEAPEGQLDSSMKVLIREWNDQPTALQILEVLNHCIYAALGSSFVIVVLRAMFNEAVTRENKTAQEAYDLATSGGKN